MQLIHADKLFVYFKERYAYAQIENPVVYGTKSRNNYTTLFIDGIVEDVTYCIPTSSV